MRKYGKTHLGTAVYMTRARGNTSTIHFAETCAHNFVSLNDDGTWEEATDIIFNLCKDGSDSYMSFKVLKFFIHPLYNGKPTCGHDFAIAITDVGSETKKNWDEEHRFAGTVV